MVASSLGRAHVCAWFFGGLGMLFLLGGALVARTPVLEQSNADVPVAASDTEAPTPATPAWAARHLLATSASTTQSPPSSRDPASAATSLRARSLPQPGSLRSLATTLAPATVVARTLRPAIDEGGFPLLHHGVRALGGAASELVGSSRFVDRAVGAIYGRDRARSYDTVDTVPTRAPLTIIYHVKPFHWTWHLDHWLSGLGRPIRMIVDPGATKFVDHSIVVVNHLSVKHTARYFAEVAKLGLRHVGAFHTGDIDFDQNYEWYKQVKFVFRNHFPTKAIALARNMKIDHVRYLPLGSLVLDSMPFATFHEFDKVRPAPLRKHLCNFIGNLKNHPARQQLANGLLRAKLIDHLKTYSIQGREGGFKCFALFTGDWSNAKQMQPYEYREVVSDSVFTLVPPGMGPSSFRMYEALELGSIPIISDSDHFNLPYGEHPLPLIPDDKWDTLPALFFEMHYKQPERILELQRRVFRWWHVWKRTFLENLACLVERDVMDSPDARKDCLTPAQFAGTSISPSEAVALKGAAQAFLESSKPKPAAKTVRRAPSSSSSSAGVRRAVPIKSARAPSRPPTKTTTAAATTTTNSASAPRPKSALQSAQQKRIAELRKRAEERKQQRLSKMRG